MIYFAEIFLLQHTDQTRTINKLILSSNTRLRETNNLTTKKGREANNMIGSKILYQYKHNRNKNSLTKIKMIRNTQFLPYGRPARCRTVYARRPTPWRGNAGKMEIVPLPRSTRNIRVSPRQSLFTVCDENVTSETFICLSNDKVEEAVSPFIGAPPLIWTKVAELREHHSRNISGEDMMYDDAQAEMVVSALWQWGEKNTKKTIYKV